LVAAAMKGRHALALAVAMSLVLSARRAAAEEGSVAAGPRVRVVSSEAPDLRVVGTLVGQDGERLSILPDAKEKEVVRVRRSSITALEASTRKSNRGRRIGIRALAGVALGAAIGIAGGDECSGPSSDYIVCLSKGDMGVLGAFAGLSVGVLAGLALSRGETWERTTPDRLTVAIGPVRRGAAVRLSFAF
jgi:hypothetical protein